MHWHAAPRSAPPAPAVFGVQRWFSHNSTHAAEVSAFAGDIDDEEEHGRSRSARMKRSHSNGLLESAFRTVSTGARERLSDPRTTVASLFANRANSRSDNKKGAKGTPNDQHAAMLKRKQNTFQYSQRQSLQTAVKSAVQAMDGEADAVFDNVEAGFRSLSRKITGLGGSNKSKTAAAVSAAVAEVAPVTEEREAGEDDELPEQDEL